MNILLLHDNANDIEHLLEAIRSDDIAVEAATDAQLAAQYLKRHSVDAVLVCVMSLQDPHMERIRAWRAEQLYEGSIVLLCPPRLAQDAYQLCCDELFDYYVTVYPLYDAFQLRLAVARAADSRRAVQQQRAAVGTVSEAISAAQTSTAEAARSIEHEWDRFHGLVGQVVERDLPGRLSESQPSNSQGKLLHAAEGLRARHGELVELITAQLDSVEQALARGFSHEQRTVVLVDDDAAFHDSMDIILRSLRYRLVWTAEPRETIELLRKVNPLALLLDVAMPSMTGIDVLQAIRADATVAHTPVILLTGQRDVQTVLAAKALGVVGYMVKPPDKSDLAAKLESIAGRSAKTGA